MGANSQIPGPLLCERPRRAAPAAAIVNLASPSFLFNGADAAAEISVSADGYTATRSAAAAANKNVRSVTSFSSGLQMVTFWPGADGADWQVDAGGNHVGFANATASLTTALYSTTNAIMWMTDGRVFINNVDIASGLSGIGRWANGCQLDCVRDVTGELFWGRVNGGAWNRDASASPGGTGGIDTSSYAGGATFAAVGLYTPSTICRAKYIAGAAPTPPGGVTYPLG